ncbi:hypothetical protein NE237_004578 [Protea cynaroides]|uniref:AMP-binding enzyme C-terminal domain-containing protein n=1 Tax=Protea cynaroides TaxID=273540 RepID=A0A9Q0KJ61_9MAGN|nr:hypothetical protein NE237_004578 [Protea cynaroides]
MKLHALTPLDTLEWWEPYTMEDRCHKNMGNTSISKLKGLHNPRMVSISYLNASKKRPKESPAFQKLNADPPSSSSPFAFWSLFDGIKREKPKHSRFYLKHRLHLVLKSFDTFFSSKMNHDFIHRGGRNFPLYSRVVEAGSCKAIVIPATGKEVGVLLRKHDLSWKDFLSRIDNLPRPNHYFPVYQSIDSITNILFSSGTTGDPKAIPWTQLSPIRCAGDSWGLQYITNGDIYCWPTNLGWPSIMDLPLVMVLVNSFRCDFFGYSAKPSEILEVYKVYERTGLDQYKVIFECCGDDQPCVGEVGLFPFYLGASDRLLNANNEELYFQGMPMYKGMPLRSQGDIHQRTIGGYFLVQGRADDTMNLGGIKTSSVEIERVCDQADDNVLETAAISVPPVKRGPEQLVIFVVLKKRYSSTQERLKLKFTKAIQSNLNPLFKVSHVRIVMEFPRTASNKLLRRVLKEFASQSRLQLL